MLLQHSLNNIMVYAQKKPHRNSCLIMKHPNEPFIIFILFYFILLLLAMVTKTLVSESGLESEKRILYILINLVPHSYIKSL